jgi:hypothetical protein
MSAKPLIIGPRGVGKSTVLEPFSMGLERLITYSGNANTLETWLRRANNTFKLAPDKSCWADYVGFLLEGKVEEWYAEVREGILSWEDFMFRMRDRWGFSREELELRLRSYSQGETQSTVEFVEEFAIRARQVTGISEYEKKTIFFQNISDGCKIPYSILQDDPSLEDLLEGVKKFARLIERLSGAHDFRGTLGTEWWSDEGYMRGQVGHGGFEGRQARRDEGLYMGDAHTNPAPPHVALREQRPFEREARGNGNFNAGRVSPNSRPGTSPNNHQGATQVGNMHAPAQSGLRAPGGVDEVSAILSRLTLLVGDSNHGRGRQGAAGGPSVNMIEGWDPSDTLADLGTGELLESIRARVEGGRNEEVWVMNKQRPGTELPLEVLIKELSYRLTQDPDLSPVRRVGLELTPAEERPWQRQAVAPPHSSRPSTARADLPRTQGAGPMDLGEGSGPRGAPATAFELSEGDSKVSSKGMPELGKALESKGAGSGSDDGSVPSLLDPWEPKYSIHASVFPPTPAPGGEGAHALLLLQEPIAGLLPTRVPDTSSAPPVLCIPDLSAAAAGEGPAIILLQQHQEVAAAQGQRGNTPTTTAQVSSALLHSVGVLQHEQETPQQGRQVGANFVFTPPPVAPPRREQDLIPILIPFGGSTGPQSVSWDEQGTSEDNLRNSPLWGGSMGLMGSLDMLHSPPRHSGEARHPGGQVGASVGMHASDGPGLARRSGEAGAGLKGRPRAGEGAREQVRQDLTTGGIYAGLPKLQRGLYSQAHFERLHALRMGQSAGVASGGTPAQVGTNAQSSSEPGRAQGAGREPLAVRIGREAGQEFEELRLAERTAGEELWDVVLNSDFVVQGLNGDDPGPVDITLAVPVLQYLRNTVLPLDAEPSPTRPPKAPPWRLGGSGRVGSGGGSVLGRPRELWLPVRQLMRARRA